MRNKIIYNVVVDRFGIYRRSIAEKKPKRAVIFRSVHRFPIQSEIIPNIGLKIEKLIQNIDIIDAAVSFFILYFTIR